MDHGREFELEFILLFVLIEFIFVQQLRWRVLGRGRSERAVVGKSGAGARGAVGAIGAVVLCASCAGCAALPAAQERSRVTEVLQSGPDVTMVNVQCGSSVLAGDAFCADVVMKDGARFRFEHVGFNSFGSTAVNVVVAKAGSLEPRVASCSTVGPANFHRTEPLGRHFNPTLIDLKEALTRYREVLEEVEFWPQCPQFYDVQSRQGQNYRYCARREGDAAEPPRPERCP